MKIVSLTLHRNTLRQRREREASKLLVSDAKKMARAKDVAGFAIVSWNEGLDCDVSWSETDKTPSNVLPEFVRGALRRKISIMDSE